MTQLIEVANTGNGLLKGEDCEFNTRIKEGSGKKNSTKKYFLKEAPKATQEPAKSWKGKATVEPAKGPAKKWKRPFARKSEELKQVLRKRPPDSEDKEDRKEKKPMAGLVPDMVGDKPNSDASELCRAWGKVRDQRVLIFFDPDAQNCFGENSATDNRGLCNSAYTCNEFSKTVLTIGSCPDCPPLQTFTNTTTCVCLGESIPSVTDGSQSSSHKRGTIIGVIVGVVLVLLLSLLGLITFKRYRYSQRKLEEKTNTVNYGQRFRVQESQGYWEAPKGVERFSLEELALATSGFDSEHEIGVGGFGKVFYGKLENGKEVAVKRASSASMQGGTEFRNEVVLLSRLHHRNLVRLEGFCEDNDLQVCLV
ncbi:hypothetical protein L7F22_048064 [Adiantum nelumboides]|nr:hypothetical protein [Adiantum nelumboides]